MHQWSLDNILTTDPDGTDAEDDVVFNSDQYITA